MGITVDGLVSGLDTSAIIDAYMSSASAATEARRTQQGRLETKLSLLQDFKGLLDDLDTAMAAYETAGDLQSVSTSTSDEDVLTVSAEDGAQVGSFAVTVNSMAVAEMERSQGYAATTDEVGEGTFSVTVAGEQTDITVSAANENNTLTGLVSAINNEVEGVSAFILNDGDAANPYRLVIMSDETGAANTISVSDTLSGGTAPTFTQEVAAADAEIELAGGLTINSATNTFEDVLPGVTLDVASEGAADIAVIRDNEATVESIQSVVDAYNDVMSFIDDETGVDEDGSTSLIAGESVLRTVESSLQSAVSGLYESGDLRGMSSLGLSTEQDGSLSLDTDELESLLESSPEDVLEMLAGADGLFASLTERIDIVVDSDNGSITLRTDSLDDQIEDFQDRIAAEEDRLEIYEGALRQQFTNLEMAMAELQTMGNYLTMLFVGNSSS